jgi:putative CocE/NonD family hydrolase
MRCPDGIHLASRLWRPDGEGPWPVLLMRQPYGRAIASTVTYAHPCWYASHGFLVVVQDVRGCGDSEGDFGGFVQEGSDGATAVRWARRLEGSNGRVGCYGFSYQGLSQLLIAKDAAGEGLDDPLPDCLAPAMCGLDERLHWASEGGAHWWSQGVGWGLQLAAERCRRRGDAEGWRQIRSQLDDGSWLRNGLALLERYDPDGMGIGWLRQDPADPRGWRCHHVSAALLRRPMLLIGGWHDPQLRGVLDLEARTRAAGNLAELHIGAWTHLNWQGGVDELQLAFFHRHLQGCGADGGAGGGGSAPTETITPPRRQLQCGSNGDWRDVAPPPAQALQGWSLDSNGLAAIRSDEGRLEAGERGGGTVTLVHDPWRPVPSRGGHLGPDPGLVERSDLDRRGDVACFTTAPLAAPLRLVGRPELGIVAAADQPGLDLAAALSVVRADGRRVHQLCTGFQRICGDDARQPLLRTLDLQPLDVSLEPGERLRLSLAAAAWPAFAPNPGNGSGASGPPGPDHRVISVTLKLEGSRLWLNPLLGAN